MQLTGCTLAALAVISLTACSSQDRDTRRDTTETETEAVEEVMPVAEIGQPAPNFELPDLDGNEVRLADFADGTVVLEWFNPGCPFVVRAHEQGELASWPSTLEDITWLAINSSAPGNQGHGVELNTAAVAKWDMDYKVLVDESGTVGHSYAAKTTPHMYVIHKGVLVYAGAIDNDQRGSLGADRINYVKQALEEIAAGADISIPESRPYGCSVKYSR